ncbi:iron-hydroxamate transporter permease subunit [Salmonella sp. NCTC 11881]|nr:iron-hydroxamate transporter permease subunit [Salmonella sp. NCTC 11881]
MSRKREMPDGGAKSVLSDLRFGRFVGRIRRSRHPALLLLALFVAACWLTWVNFSVALPRSQWQQAIWSPDIDIIEQMIFSLQPAAKTGDFAAGGRGAWAGRRPVPASIT